MLEIAIYKLAEKLCDVVMQYGVPPKGERYMPSKQELINRFSMGLYRALFEDAYHQDPSLCVKWEQGIDFIYTYGEYASKGCVSIYLNGPILEIIFIVHSKLINMDGVFSTLHRELIHALSLCALNQEVL